MSKIEKSLLFNFDQNHPVVTIRRPPELIPLKWPLRYQNFIAVTNLTLGLNYPWYEIHGTEMIKIDQPMVDDDELAHATTVSSSAVSVSMPGNHQQDIPSSFSMPSTNAQGYDSATDETQTSLAVEPSLQSEQGIGGVSVTEDAVESAIDSGFTLGSGSQHHSWADLKSIYNDTLNLVEADQWAISREKRRVAYQTSQKDYTEYQKIRRIELQHLRDDLSDTLTFAKSNAVMVIGRAKHKHATIDRFAKAKLAEWEQQDTMDLHVDDLRYLQKKLTKSQQHVDAVKKKAFSMVKGVQEQCDLQLKQFDQDTYKQQATLQKIVEQRKLRLDD